MGLTANTANFSQEVKEDLVEWMNRYKVYRYTVINIVSQVIRFFESSPKRTSVLTAEIERTGSKRKEIKAVVQN